MNKMFFSFLIFSLMTTLSIKGENTAGLAQKNFNLFAFDSELDSNADSLTSIECTVHPIERKAHSHGNQQVVNGLRIIEANDSSSLNWSGYVAITGTSEKPDPRYNSVSHISGFWVVPALSGTQCDSFSAAWVGIDGYVNSVVEQIGTEHDLINGTPSYYAWFSLYPAPTQVIEGFPVNPGDEIEGSVTYKGQDDCGNSIFYLVIKNYTQKVKFSTIQHTLPGNPAHLSSANWIVEAPSIVDPRIACLNIGILPLANFGKISFAQCKATINGRSGAINNKHWTFDAITMTAQGLIKARPSDLYKCPCVFSNSSKLKGSCFDVTWVSSGPCPFQVYCPPIVP